MLFRQLFEPDSSTYTYLISCPDTGQTALIDPVLDTAERDAALLQELGLALLDGAVVPVAAVAGEQLLDHAELGDGIRADRARHLERLVEQLLVGDHPVRQARIDGDRRSRDHHTKSMRVPHSTIDSPARAAAGNQRRGCEGKSRPSKRGCGCGQYHGQPNVGGANVELGSFSDPVAGWFGT